MVVGQVHALHVGHPCTLREGLYPGVADARTLEEQSAESRKVQVCSQCGDTTVANRAVLDDERLQTGEDLRRREGRQPVRADVHLLEVGGEQLPQSVRSHQCGGPVIAQTAVQVKVADRSEVALFGEECNSCRCNAVLHLVRRKCGWGCRRALVAGRYRIGVHPL